MKKGGRYVAPEEGAPVKGSVNAPGVASESPRKALLKRKAKKVKAAKK